MWSEPILTAVGVLLADQSSKALVASCDAVPESFMNRPFLSLQYSLNRRGARAPLIGSRALVVTWTILIAVAVLVLQHDVFGSKRLGPIGLAAAIGGATGNLFDRLRKGAVVDFIAIGPWPVFNLADVAIVAGIILVLLSIP